MQNQRLEALYAVSGLASDAASLTELANAFVRQVRKVAGADAVAVRWSDEANERYVLLANDGLPGPWRKKSIACTRALAIAASPRNRRAPASSPSPHIHGGAAPLPRSRV